jgi:CBS domain-containing protein
VNIFDICQRDVVSVNGKATVQEAAQMMRDRHVGCVVVTDPEEPGRVMGMLTDRDLVVRLLAQGLPAEGQAVGPLSRSELAGVPRSATVQEAVEAMHTAGVRRLLVTQADGSITGIVSMDDILDALALQVEALAGALHSGIAREAARTRLALSAQPAQAMYLTRNEP